MFITAPVAPILGAVRVPSIHLLKPVRTGVAPLSQLPTLSEQVGDWLRLGSRPNSLEMARLSVSAPICGRWLARLAGSFQRTSANRFERGK